MGKPSKKYRAAAETIDATQAYGLEDAIGLVCAAESRKFDESVDIAINLGVDPKHADQMVRGAIVLPNGVGRDTRVLVFAKGEKEKEALEAGADHVGGDDLAKKIQDEGWFEFDRVIATPDMMGVVGRLGRVLGPRGLMPNPKVGTVTPNVAEAVNNAKAGQVRYRTDKGGIIHCIIGKVDFPPADLQLNLEALLRDLVKMKPSSAKGVYLEKITVSSTMGPGLTVEQGSLSS